MTASALHVGRALDARRSPPCQSQRPEEPASRMHQWACCTETRQQAAVPALPIFERSLKRQFRGSSLAQPPVSRRSNSTSSRQWRQQHEAPGPRAALTPGGRVTRQLQQQQPLPRDTPVTWGPWYREAMKDKRPPPLLGTLPPGLLRWMVRELQSGEIEEWGELAAKVLEDPVYRDRAEWTEYQKRLEKKGAKAAHAYAAEQGWVSFLDTGAWHGVEMDKIGTSFSQPIPRVGQENSFGKNRLAIELALSKEASQGRRSGAKKDAPRARPRRVVCSEEVYQRRSERRLRQTERREKLLSSQASAADSPDAPSTDRRQKGEDSLPDTRSRDWLISLVERQEQDLERVRSKKLSQDGPGGK